MSQRVRPRAKTTRQRDGRDGIGVDAAGGPAFDPTENVVAIIDAAVARQDDIRSANILRFESELKHLQELAVVRETCSKEMAVLRERHAKEMGVAETNRLNAIRQVDALAVTTAADRAQAAIQTLAAVTTSTAENLRSALTATATTIAAQTAAQTAAITERLASLEKSSYEGKGKQSYADPMMAEQVVRIERLMAQQAGSSGKSEGTQAFAGYIFAAVGALVGLIGLAFALLKP